MAPFLFFFFRTTRQHKRFIPDYILINGTVKCQHSLINVTSSVYFYSFSRTNQIIDGVLCNEKSISARFEWNHSVQTCFRANKSTDVCRGWNPCMSMSRVKDGQFDCGNRGDEVDRTNEDIDQSTCLTARALGDDREDCRDRYDERWQGTNRRLRDMKSSERKRDACSLLRRYIEQSNSPMNINVTRSMVRMSFGWYCDAF